MIDENRIMQAVGGRIAGSGSFPRIAWANRDAAPALPYLALVLVPLRIDDDTLAQDAPVWVGLLQATIVSSLNDFDTNCWALRTLIAALFPSASKLALADGTSIRVTSHPQPQPSYRDGPNNRTPLQIKLSSEPL